MNALENSTEIMFNPRIRDEIETKFKFYLTHNEKTKHRNKIDKIGLMNVFE